MKKSELPDTAEILKDIGTLIVEVRTPTLKSGRGREEGVHCAPVLHPHVQHACDVSHNTQCQRLSELHVALTPLPSNKDITIRVDVVGSNLVSEVVDDGGSLQISPGDGELLLERWIIMINHHGENRAGCTKLMLLQAVHSHLHFSQLSAWLSLSRGSCPNNIEYRIEANEKIDFKASPDEHRFPICDLGESRSVVIVTYSLPRSKLHIPDLVPYQDSTNPTKPVKLTLPLADKMLTVGDLVKCMSSPTRSKQIKKNSRCELTPTTIPLADPVPIPSEGGVCVISSAEPCRRFSFDPLLDDSGIHSPGSSFRNSTRSSETYSPSFYIGDESSLDSIPDFAQSLAAAFQHPLAVTNNQSISPTPYNSPQHITAMFDNPAAGPLTAMFESSEGPLRSTPYPWPLSDMFYTSLTTKPPPRIVTSSPTPSTSKPQLDNLRFSPIKFDSPMKFRDFKREPSLNRRSSSLCIEEEDEFGEVSPNLAATSPDDIRASWHGNPFLDKPAFKRCTSLPLLSSPVAYRKTYSRTERKISSQKVVNYDKNCLLGSFEESILKDRISPCGTISGFKFKMSASGLFSSPPITLPFTAQFYNLCDEYCPSPYSGCVKLDQCGTHGYQVSKQGRIQATVLDPENSVIRIFLIPYDVRDMPPRSQTFLRQRVHSVPRNKSKSLQYLINIRLMSGRTSRVYLHTDIRVLFVRGTNTIDQNCVENLDGTLETENCIPSNPKYSTISKTKRSS